MLLVVQGLKTVSSYIQSGLIVVYGEAKSIASYSIVAGTSSLGISFNEANPGRY